MFKQFRQMIPCYDLDDVAFRLADLRQNGHNPAFYPLIAPNI
ncbi:MAG: hypothetical protein AB3N13_14800 [Arenibacterium sp.]